MSQPSLPLVNLVSITLFTLFYGMYFIVFVLSIYFILEAASARGVQTSGTYMRVVPSAAFISAWALFLAITGDWVVTVLRAFQGFIYFHDGMGAALYWSDNSQVTETIGGVFLALSVCIGDAMIIYRLWVVWSYNKTVIILPTLSLLGLFISFVIEVVGTKNLPNLALDISVTPISVFTLVTNIYCTGMISWEIWRITRYCMPTGGMNLRDFLAIVVESATLYTSWVIFYTICHEMNSNIQFIALGALPPLVGLANALIHVRVALGRTIEQLHGSAKAGSSKVSASIHFIAPQSSEATGGGVEV
ncbi:hypothetical protein FB451DRAFT_1535485 [Mycena latifolia]|nr:hypothetical protein FB451DRAFT_1535485 [Mycena latifolia]